MQLFTTAQKELTRSNADRKHPFRLFQLGTFGEFPEVRTVVKRNFDQDWQIYFYTDSRSHKVAQIQAHNKVSAHFWHPKKQLQIRMYGIADIITEGALFEAHLQKATQQSSMKDYRSNFAPGKVLEEEDKLKHEENLHFTIITIATQAFEVLQLSREGHRRSKYVLQEETWQAFELVP